MTDYERGVRDAIKFLSTHTMRTKIKGDELEHEVVEASEQSKNWEGSKTYMSVMSAAAVLALVKTEEAA